jgi:hypothetical protein
VPEVLAAPGAIAAHDRPHLEASALQVCNQVPSDEPSGAEDAGFQPRHATVLAGTPALTEYSGSSWRTIEPAPTTHPRRRTAPSRMTELAPIHTSSSMTMPPLLGLKPCSRMGRARSLYS